MSLCRLQMGTSHGAWGVRGRARRFYKKSLARKERRLPLEDPPQHRYYKHYAT